MAVETFDANDLIYTVSPEPELPDGMKTWAVLVARVVDEITVRPPLGGARIQTPFLGLSPRVSPGGLLGFAAIPVRVFPSLKAKSYTVPVTIQVDGYIPLFLSVKILAIPTFPDSFTPTDLGTLNLHRLPTVIAGRVVLNTGIDFLPIAGATVTLTGVWQTPPPANLVVAPDPPDLVSLTPGLYFDRPQAGTQIQGLGPLGGPGPDKQLLQEADVGQTLLRLSDRRLINIGDILAIDAGDAERTEYITIHAIAGASTPDQPASITLDAPLRSLHRQGAVVHKVQFNNVGVATQLTRDVITGDICLFVNGVGNLAAAPFVAISTGGGVPEYHATGYFSAVSDAQGFFRWPPLSRVAQCGLRAHDGAHPDLDQTLSPDYPEEVSRIDFVYQ